LAARVQASARDVSLHTKSAAGAKINDSLMTISQTAKKWGVNTDEYIRDRVSGEFKLPSLAELIQQKSQADKAADLFLLERVENRPTHLKSFFGIHYTVSYVVLRCMFPGDLEKIRP
jgi:hypothetical protein